MTEQPASSRSTTSPTAAKGSYRETVKQDALVQARAALGVALARYWLALNRASDAEGATRTAALAQARDELEQATGLRRRVQALQTEQFADTPGSHEPEATQRVRRPPNATADPPRRNGTLVGRLPAQVCTEPLGWPCALAGATNLVAPFCQGLSSV